MAITTYTPNEIITAALQELGVIGASETPSSEDASVAFKRLNKLVDYWRTQGYLKYARVRSVYNLASGTATYTLGDGGTFDSIRPERILSWSVIPDDDASDPQEIPMGAPATWEEWQQISIKTTTGARPSVMWPDWAFSAGLLTLSFYPVPDNNDVDVVLYTEQGLSEFADKTTAVGFPPGVIRALELNLAVDIAPTFGAAASMSGITVRNAEDALAWIKRTNARPRPAQLRPEFLAHSQRGGRASGIGTI